MRRAARIDNTAKPHKYGAKRTTVDGLTFASKAEARRYLELKLLQKAGQIKDFQLQPKYPITVKGRVVATYIADFFYVTDDGDPVIEDVKGVKTPVYRLKKKLVEAQYGIEITEVR